MATEFHVNPRFRAYGRARIDIAKRANTREEWEKLWRPPQNSFPFEWGIYWKQCVEYRVGDYAAEVGFYIDVLGFPVNAFDAEYAQFTSPDGEFFIAVVPVQDLTEVTPPDSLRLQFMIHNLEQTAKELEIRGVAFERLPEPLQPGSQLMLASFRSPNGILIELWGEKKSVSSTKPLPKQPDMHTADYQQKEKTTLRKEEISRLAEKTEHGSIRVSLHDKEVPPSQVNNKIRLQSLDKLTLADSKMSTATSETSSQAIRSREANDIPIEPQDDKNQWYSYRVAKSGSVFRRSPN